MIRYSPGAPTPEKMFNRPLIIAQGSEKVNASEKNTPDFSIVLHVHLLIAEYLNPPQRSG